MLDEILAIVDLNHPRPATELLPCASDGAFTSSVKRLHARKFVGFPQSVERTHRDGGAGEGPGKHEAESDTARTKDV